MEHEPKHDGPKPPPPHHPHCSWASWHSPIGLGFFFFTTALAAAIALYALLNLVGTIITIMRPAPTFSYPADTSSYQTSGDSLVAPTGAAAE